MDLTSHDQGVPFWMTTDDVRVYVRCSTNNAARQWIWRKGIKRRSNGTVSRLDVDRALAVRSRRGDGLRDYHAAQRAQVPEQHT